MLRNSGIVVLLSMFIMVTGMGCSHSGIKNGEPVELPVKQLGAKGSQTSGYKTLPEYRVSSGDVLELLFHVEIKPVKKFKLTISDVVEIKFPEVSDLDQDQRIRPDGMISLPYLGDVKAAGLSPAELRETLKGMYAKVLKNPELYVVVKEFGAKVEDLKESMRNAARGQSKLVTVRNDGYTTFPIIGELKVVDKTIPELTKELNSRFSDVSQDISVDLLVNQSAGAKVCVLGAVNRPGYYNITKPLTVVEALALAGGFRDDAELSSIIAMRRIGDKMVHMAVDSSTMLENGSDGSHWLITSGDIVYVSRKSLSEASDTARQIGELIFFRGVSVGAGYDLRHY